MANIQYNITDPVNSGSITQEDVFGFVEEVSQLKRIVPPVGTVLPFAGVTFSGVNSGATILPDIGAQPGATVIDKVNNWLALPEVTDGKWVVCDGSAPNDPESPIWNAPGRHVPNLTDNRFIVGTASAGGSGGSTTHCQNTLNSFSVSGTLNGSKASFCTNQNVDGVSTDGVGLNASIMSGSNLMNSHTHNVAHYHQFMYVCKDKPEVFTYTSGNAGCTSINSNSDKIAFCETRLSTNDLSLIAAYNSGAGSTPRNYFTSGALYTNTNCLANSTEGNNATSCSCRPSFKSCAVNSNNGTGYFSLDGFQDCQNNHTHNISYSPFINFDNRPLYLTNLYIIRIK